MPLHPEVLWAQRKDRLYLTIALSDIQEPKTDLKSNRLTFTCKQKDGNVTNDYGIDIPFYDEVSTDDAKIHATARNLQLCIFKKNKEAEYWPRLQKDKVKPVYLKVDFDRWVDEDDELEGGAEQDDAGFDFANMMNMANMGGMPGMPGMPADMNDLPEDDESDDEEVEETKSDNKA
ncbi:HSP20-like chaperone [Radiomyces spectabilis]|uniref:HSP20-like chaperone n=1 Tax=Radiomyces spectabilis TaxID=64574 RepID=UPI0022201C27|nr:HSP20-like chaperone [Radiomyces spectabilis]KAI8371416.1 HSP20-like chaperone [Radiomyces spectabilis]